MLARTSLDSRIHLVPMGHTLLRSTYPLLATLLLTGLAHLGHAADTPVVTVFAAASTTVALNEIATAYGMRTNVRITCSFGGSSLLAKQIESGAPADVFISADQKWMDYLEKKQYLASGTRIDLLGNSLMIVTPVAKPLAVTVEPGFAFAASFTGRLAVGDPTHVPVGIYAMEAFTALGWWQALEARLAPAADVRGALKLVEMGEADAGVVYATDAKISAKVTVAAAIPPQLHTAIRYPAALTVKSTPAAAAFLAYLRGPAARAVFARAGFSDPGAAAAPVAAP